MACLVPSGNDRAFIVTLMVHGGKNPSFKVTVMVDICCCTGVENFCNGA